MSKIAYVGPTIIGVATRNTIYSSIPDSLTEAAENAPYLLSLCVPISSLPAAMKQIADQKGYIYTFYRKALAYKASSE
ncbi:MAG: hypothetical protein LUG55_08070 [Clostridiales bacterium]|nr:hypothetical protein [Clostridiales bacterium]